MIRCNGSDFFKKGGYIGGVQERMATMFFLGVSAVAGADSNPFENKTFPFADEDDISTSDSDATEHSPFAVVGLLLTGICLAYSYKGCQAACCPSLLFSSLLFSSLLFSSLLLQQR